MPPASPKNIWPQNINCWPYTFNADEYGPKQVKTHLFSVLGHGQSTLLVLLTSSNFNLSSIVLLSNGHSSLAYSSQWISPTALLSIQGNFIWKMTFSRIISWEQHFFLALSCYAHWETAEDTMYTFNKT